MDFLDIAFADPAPAPIPEPSAPTTPARAAAAFNRAQRSSTAPAGYSTETLAALDRTISRQEPQEAPKPDPEANPTPAPARAPRARQTPQGHPYNRPAQPGPAVSLAYCMAWKPKTVNLASGPRRILTAEPTGPFWKAWKARKPQMKAAGYSVRCCLGIWEVTNWNGEAREI